MIVAAARTPLWPMARIAINVVAAAFIVWAWRIAVAAIADGAVERFAIDAHAYWSVNLSGLYAGATVGELDAFLYSPAAAQSLAPATALPWPIFYAVWTGVLFLCLALVAGPPLAALLLLFPPVWADLTTGNVHMLLAVAIVLGFRYSAFWSIVLLTKVTPGVGLLWFAARREWRSLIVAIGTTAAVVLVSYVSAPDLWAEWILVLTANTGEPPRLFGLPLAARLPVAGAIVVIGALTDRRWFVPIAATIALPVLWENSITLLLAALPLVGWGPLRRAASPPAAALPSGPVELSS